MIIYKELLDKLKEIFDDVKNKMKEPSDDVETEELIYSMAETDYFERNQNNVVRVDFDESKETLEMVLVRIKELHKDPTINWHNFLGYFSKKGRIRPGETLNI